MGGSNVREAGIQSAPDQISTRQPRQAGVTMQWTRRARAKGLSDADRQHLVEQNLP
jgi:hypothetical protein